MLFILSNAKNLAKYVEQSLREILHCVQDDRNLWVNCDIIFFQKMEKGFLLLIPYNGGVSS